MDNTKTMDYTNLKNFSDSKEKADDLSVQTDALKSFFSQFSINNKRVAIITPPLQFPETINPKLVSKKAYHLYPPLGQLYICSSIEESTDWDVDLYDLHFTMLKNAANNKDFSLKALIEMIPMEYDAYLVGCMFSTSHKIYNTVGKLLAKRNKPRVFGGVYATGFSDDLLDKGVTDIVIKHEGENQIVNLLKFWEYEEWQRNELEIRNTSFRYNDSNINFPKLFEKIEPPNIVPQLKRIKDDLKEYNQHGTFGHVTTAIAGDRLSASIIGNRGCRAACTFCSVAKFMGPKVRSTNEDIVIDTIKYLYEECGVRHIDWLDDDLVAYPESATKLFNRIADLNYDLVFTIQNAILARNINKDLIDAIGRAGFVHVGFGVESGNEAVRKKIKRITLIDNLEETIEYFREKFPHVFIHCNFMLGFPGETVEEIIQTFNLAMQLKVDWCQFALVQALPNTRMWDQFVEIDDSRIHTPSKYSPASAAKLEGLSIDEIGLKIGDIFSLPKDKVLDLNELNDIWYPINTTVNFLNNYNLVTNTDNIWKLKHFLNALRDAYPLDPTMLLTLAKCYEIEENNKKSDEYKASAKEIIKKYKFWKELLTYLKKFDNSNIIAEAV